MKTLFLNRKKDIEDIQKKEKRDLAFCVLRILYIAVIKSACFNLNMLTNPHSKLNNKVHLQLVTD